jgi:hypothetical protein
MPLGVPVKCNGINRPPRGIFRPSFLTEYAMVDLLFALGQFLSVIALLYGLILTVAHRDCVDEMRSSYDPITGHDWLAIRALPSPHSFKRTQNRVRCTDMSRPVLSSWADRRSDTRARLMDSAC